MGTGADKEREMVRNFNEIGVPAIRSPGSGSATDRCLPDVLFIFNGQLYADENKYTSGDYVYYDEKEVEDLCEFAFSWGAIPTLSARFSYDSSFYFQFVDLSQLYSDHTWSLKRSEKDSYWTIEDLIQGRVSKY